MKELHENNLSDRQKHIEKLNKEHEIYVKNLKEQLSSQEKHLDDQKQTGDNKTKELEKQLEELRREHQTKMEMKQDELNDLTTEIVDLKIETEKQKEEIEKRIKDEVEHLNKIKSLTQASADCERLGIENKELLKNNT